MKNLKILLIDDEEQMRSYLNELFKSRFEVEADLIEDCLDGYIRCREKKYDVIICDHRTPFMNGADFVQALRLKENINKETPIIFISGYLNESLLFQNNETSKKIKFLRKPFSNNDLIKCILEFVQ